MVSLIDPTKPQDNLPAVKSELRANLQVAKSEIEALQAAKIPAGGGTNQVLAKTSTADYATQWVTPAPGGGGGGSPVEGATELSQLSDVNTTGAVSGNTLAYDGAAWVPNGNVFTTTEKNKLAGLAVNSTTVASAGAVMTTGNQLVSTADNNALTTNPKFWAGTQAQYDALVTPSADTLYFILAT